MQNYLSGKSWVPVKRMSDMLKITYLENKGGILKFALL